MKIVTHIGQRKPTKTSEKILAVMQSPPTHKLGQMKKKVYLIVKGLKIIRIVKSSFYAVKST